MSLDPDEAVLPNLDDSWLTPNERQIRLERHCECRARRTNRLNFQGFGGGNAPPAHPDHENENLNPNVKQVQNPPTVEVSPAGQIQRDRPIVNPFEIPQFDSEGANQDQDPLPDDDEDDLSVAELQNDLREFHGEPELPPPRPQRARERPVSGRPNRVSRRPTHLTTNRFGEWANLAEKRKT